MSQYTLLSQVDRTTSYPTKTTVSAPNNCGTLILMINTPFTEQQLCELPSINVRILTGANEVLYNFDILLSTVNTNVNPLGSIEPYSIPIYDVPQSFKLIAQPIFDNYALSAHNECVECGNVEILQTVNGIVSQDVSSYLWTTPTQTFDISVYFDNSNVKSGGSSGGGGGGGGGSDQAVDIQYDNSLSGLTATNVQDALTELAEHQSTTTTTEKTITLYATNWTNGTYQLQDSSIKSNSNVYINVPDGITKEQYDAIAYANIVSVGQSNGYVILSSLRTVPTINVPIRLVVQTSS
jgi:hypothetical protein